jgi:hypothetical protein
MANNYTQPTIPATLVTDVELDLLSRAGFEVHSYKDSNGSCLEHYLTVEEGFVYDFDEWLEELYEGELKDVQYENISDIFQAIISRSLESEEDEDIDEFVIKGAYTCSKMRPGEFGGFVIRITADNVQEESTETMLERFREGRN